MKYRPGSFSKNFAWHGKGFRKLYDAIRNGFGGKTEPIGREDWRDASQINDGNLELIPLNFFLHNTIRAKKNFVSVDELVFQATALEHSLQFDRLALFSFHLNRVGSRVGTRAGEAAPVEWSNVFIRDLVWKSGAWQRDALELVPQQ